MTQQIPLTSIRANTDQPRKAFDFDKLRELADSILTNGLIQPITVRPLGKSTYEIVAGERRFRAFLILQRERAGFDMIACNVRKMADLQRDVEAIIENLQRVDIAPMEEANAFQRLTDAGLSVEDIATKLGLAPFRVRWRLQLLNLSPQILPIFESGQIDRQQAMELSRLPSHHDQHRVLHMINRGQAIGWKAVRNVVEAIVDEKSQADIFGDAAPAAAEGDLATLSRMERRIETVAQMIGRGWKDGECIIASKVNPDRATKMADTVSEIQKALRIMERELRNVSAQAALFVAA